ncbi:hypothetical protein EVAR_98531_1 [Eumeta japonica]|uniref:Uncharacterized protein n=1 Tax=Eumeta variegata TaxID=151549 RepID=A0A4C1ZYI1_EUMVA|nr:hypothetical protein EVAR_98531_1 [Eumeta japonica]
MSLDSNSHLRTWTPAGGSVSVKNGVPPNLVESSPRPNVKMEKRGKQNRIMVRPQPVNARPNPAAMGRSATCIGGRSAPCSPSSSALPSSRL